MSRYIFLFCIAFFPCYIGCQKVVTVPTDPKIIPLPQQYLKMEGHFTFDLPIQIVTNSNEPIMAIHVAQLNAWLEEQGIERAIESAKKIQLSLLSIPSTALGEEGYQLNVRDKDIVIQANNAKGIFYGIQTLRQMVPIQTSFWHKTMGLDACQITDTPRFGWRGLMLDASRHFHSVASVKTFIDVLAHYKMNTFHWHLTDDQGWRIEIKSLPKLTEVGAWRVERKGRFGSRNPPSPDEPTTYGGFYTHEDIKEIIQYAQERHVTVIPEIDVPGHSMAALAAYPELSVGKAPKMVNPGSKFSEWYGGGKFKMLIDNTLNPSDSMVYVFLDKVFTEVAMLFPAAYIHVGGDECDTHYWLEDANCQALMKREKLEDGHALQSYFMKKVAEIIASKGKKMMGWDEIMEGGLAEGAAVMSWRGMEAGIEATKLGHPVVMSPTQYAYLDYTQGDPTVENPIYADLHLRKCYSFEPTTPDMDQQWLLGIQGNVWCEHIPDLETVLTMTYPRGLAIAETAWTAPEKKDWNHFFDRLEHHFERLDIKQLGYSKAIYDPIVSTKPQNKGLQVTIRTDVPGAVVYYTTDGKKPNKKSSLASIPFTLPVDCTILFAQTYRDDTPIGRLLEIPLASLKKRAGKVY